MSIMTEQQLNTLFGNDSPSDPKAFRFALADTESGFNSALRNPAGTATGLFQITQDVVTTFDGATGKKYSLEDMSDPSKCAEVSDWLVNFIVNSYRKMGMLRDFTFNTATAEHDFASLVHLAYYAGPTEVPAIIQKLIAGGKSPDSITIDDVMNNGPTMYPQSTILSNGGGFLSDPSASDVVDRFGAAFIKWATKYPPISATQTSSAPVTPQQNTIVSDIPDKPSPAIQPKSSSSDGLLMLLGLLALGKKRKK